MKKISLLVATAALCFGANAGVMNQQVSVNHRPAHQHVAAMAKAKAADGPEFTWKLITEQPEGELKTYARGGVGIGYDDNYNQTVLSQNGMALQVVYTHNEDNVVYLKDPVSRGQNNVWVEGKIEDNKIVVPAFQVIADYDDYGLAICQCDLVYDERSERYGWLPNTEVAEVTYTINDDETISLDFSEVDEASGYGVKMLGLMYTDDLTWVGLGDWGSVYTPVTEQIAEIPADVEFEDFAFCATGQSFIVQCGTDGQNFYIAGLSEGPSVGVIEGNTVTFVSDQYLGCKGNWMTYLVAATYEDIYLEDIDVTYSQYTSAPTIVMNYDADAKILSPVDENAALLLAICKSDAEQIDFIEAYNNPVVKIYVEVPGAPVAPVVEYFMDYRDYYDQYYIDFLLSNITVAGDYIKPSQMEWALYADDEVYVFSPDDNYYISEDIDWLPYDFNDEMGGYDIASDGAVHFAYVYAGLYNELGVQSRACFDGVYYYSDIVYIDVETEEIRIQKVENDTPTAITTVSSQQSQSLFDLQGRRALKSAKGLTIGNGAVRFVK